MGKRTEVHNEFRFAHEDKFNEGGYIQSVYQETTSATTFLTT